MSIVILKWNPAISSYTLGRSDDGFEEARCYRNYELNWSFWEYEKVHEGDRFFMLRVGEGNTGVVMSGTVTSEPYRGQDWSGKGRVTYYADILPDFMIDSEEGPVLETAALQSAMPDFQWDGGHSGMVLPAEYEEKLEWLWCEFLLRCYHDSYSEAMVCNVRGLQSPEILNYYQQMVPLPIQKSLLSEKGDACEVCGFSYRKAFVNGGDISCIYRLFDVEENLRAGFHCVCPNCMTFYEKMKSEGDVDFKDVLQASFPSKSC